MFISHSGVEYSLLWGTFFSVMQWGLEGGIAAGILCATVYFSYAYARSQVQNFEAGRARSSVVRTVEHQSALALLRDTHTVTVQLQGFVFFGSASSIGTKLNDVAAVLAGDTSTQIIDIEHLDYGFDEKKCNSALQAAPKFLIIDFAKVTGIDSSGARTIAGVTRELDRHGIAPILTGIGNKGMLKLLAAHEVNTKHMVWPPEVIPRREGAGSPVTANLDYELPSTPKQENMIIADTITPIVYVFHSLEEGLRFCEDALLEVAVRYGLCTPPSAGVTLEDLVMLHLEKVPLLQPKSAEKIARELRRYMTQQTVRRGESLWYVGDLADELILVERGVIRVDQFSDLRDSIWNGGVSSPPAREEDRGYEFPGFHGWMGPEHAGTAAAQLHAGSKPIRSFELGPGCVGGSTDFFLARPHSTHAICASVACRVLRFSKESMSRMASEAPAALNVLQLCIMRLNSSDLFSAAEYTNLS